MDIDRSENKDATAAAAAAAAATSAAAAAATAPTPAQDRPANPAAPLAPAVTLMSLPPEVLARIFKCQRLTNRDFFALRGTCRRARDMSRDVVEGMHPSRTELGALPTPRIVQDGRFPPQEVLAFATRRLLSWRVDFRSRREVRFLQQLPASVRSRLSLVALCRPKVSEAALLRPGSSDCRCTKEARAFNIDVAADDSDDEGRGDGAGGERPGAGAPEDPDVEMRDAAEDQKALAKRRPRLIDGVDTLDFAWCQRVNLARVPELRNVQRVDLSHTGVQDLGPLKYVRHIELRSCLSLTSVAGLGGGSVATLNLAGCSQLTDLAPLTAKAMPSLRVLNITGLRVASLQGLGFLEKLFAGAIRQLEDVSPVASVPELYLGKCTSLVDVSCLAKVKKLSLRFCPGVVDASALGAVQSLDLSGTSITSVEGLGKVPRLRLEYCRRLTSLAGLGAQNHTVDVSWNELSDLSPLHGVPVVVCRGLRMLTNVSPLVHAVAVDLRGCTRLTDISPLLQSTTLRDVILENTAVSREAHAEIAKRCRIHLGLSCLPMMVR